MACWMVRIIYNTIELIGWFSHPNVALFVLYLIPEPPNENVQRFLILISKTLQNIANGTLPGKKEQYMESMNGILPSVLPLSLLFNIWYPILPVCGQLTNPCFLCFSFFSFLSFFSLRFYLQPYQSCRRVLRANLCKYFLLLLSYFSHSPSPFEFKPDYSFILLIYGLIIYNYNNNNRVKPIWRYLLIHSQYPPIPIPMLWFPCINTLKPLSLRSMLNWTISPMEW